MTDGPARRLAEELDRRGLAVPGRLLADAHRPLAPLLTDLGAAFGPIIGAALGRLADDPRALLDDPLGLDRLVEQLDRRANGGTRAKPG
ncbi:MAG: hypothetical protein H0W10_07490 [Chloroflexi bacterium]|nr:hypothetical protein [Chloroflexota bacterium]